MSSDRVTRILAQLDAAGDGDWSSAQLCEVSRDVVGATGAGVMLMSGDVPKGTLCTTDGVSDLIEQLQYTLGEGPCVDAHNEGRVVVEPDLSGGDSTRWMAFRTPVTDAGARAVFAFPLQVGAVRLGALNLYRDEPGPLSDEQHADGLVIADIVARWVLDVQAAAPAGAMAQQLQAGADYHFVVHNAAGAVSVQLGVSVTEALIRLRALAFITDRPLLDIAEDVVARRLRL